MKTIVGNWKMNLGSRESVALARGVILALRGKKTLPEVVVCPPFPALGEVHKVTARSHVQIGAQNLFWEEKGAFTGEVSSRMLTELGASHVIIGHSERRRLLGETDAMVHQKLAAALSAKLVPIFCVGESKEQRDAGQHQDIVAAQLHAGLSGLRLRPRDQFFVAYEPVWAIGTGVAATPADAVAMHSFIRTHLRDVIGEAAGSVRVLYGGSVDGANIYSFLREPEVDGVLVGGASVKLQEFKRIIDTAVELMEGNE
jgi:triosephosphate isomerase